MPTFTRSIGMLPFQGGTLETVPGRSSFIRLSDTRGVALYYQKSPDWLVGTVVDVDGGFTSGNEPTIVNTQLITKMTQGTPIVMLTTRINQNTFLITNKSTASNNFQWFVFEIDSDDGIAMVDSGSFALDNSVFYSAESIYSQTGLSNCKFVPLRDNLILYVAYMGKLSGTRHVPAFKAEYDPMAKKLIWNMTGTDFFTPSNYIGEVITRPVPGHDWTMIQFRTVSTWNNWYELHGTHGVIVDNQTGDVVVGHTQLPVRGSNGTGDMIPLPGNRIVTLTNQHKTINFYEMDYTNNTATNIGSGDYTSTFNNNYGSFVMPLSPDYVVLMQRQQLFSGAYPRLKIIRRYDRNFFEQTPASLGNNNEGFTTNFIAAVDATRTNQHQGYPEMIDGKIIWFGMNGTGTRFSWTVISL